MQKIIAENLDKITLLCKQNEVKSLYAFGSVCTDRFNETSDIDLLIAFKYLDYGEYAEKYFELAEAFEQLFHRPVDLVTEKSLSNPYFINSVNENKVLLYGK